MERRTTPEQDIRGAGLRCTAQRLAVLEALRAAPRHLPVDEVVRLVRARLGGVSTQAVYDTLAALTAAGLARRVQPAGSPTLFEAWVGEQHDHLVCSTCGAVTDVARADRPPPTPATPGWRVDETEITHWGVCPSCRRRPTTQRSEP